MMINQNTNNNSQIKNDLQAFLKIKPLTIPISNPYLSIAPNKTYVTYTSIKKTTKEKIPINYDLDKVFSEHDEYSYIYEHIANECLSDVLTKTNYGFIAYGETTSEKHSILFGEYDCHNNTSTRGVFPRLLEQLITRDNISIHVSTMAVISNKLIDVAKNAKQHTTNMSIASEDNVMNIREVFNSILQSAYDVVQKPEIVNKIHKVKVDSVDSIKTYLHHCNTFFNFINKYQHLSYDESNLLSVSAMKDHNTNIGKQQHKPLTAFLHTFSNFVYVIYIMDTKGQTQLSNVTLCELAGNDQFITKVTGPVNNVYSNMHNTKAIIDNTNTIENLKKAICSLKKSYITDSNRDPSSKITDISGFDAKLTIVLKNLMFHKKTTKFRVIGCVCPNAGMHEVVKDTLNFLFECRKITNPRKIDLEKELINIEDKTNKDDIIYALEERCRVYINKCKELNEIIEQKNERNKDLQESYRKQMNCLKECFNFNGDINVLLSGNQFTKEAKYAKKIREAFDNAKVKLMQNNELEQKVSELELEIEKLKNNNEIQLRNEVMTKYFNELQAKQSNEQERLKNELQHSNEIQNAKAENELLLKINKQYQQDNERKGKVIQHFQKLLQQTIDHKEEVHALRKEIQNESSKIMKNEMTQYKHFIDSERKVYDRTKDTIIQSKQTQITELKTQIENTIHTHKAEEKQLLIENTLLYELLMNLLSKFKKDFQSKTPQFITPNNFNTFINARDVYYSIIETTERNVNVLNFPKTITNADNRNAKMFKTTEFKELKMQPLLTMQRKGGYAVWKGNDNVKEYIAVLESQNKKLQKENEMLKGINNTTTHMLNTAGSNDKGDKVVENNMKDINLLSKEEIENELKRLKEDKDKMRIKLNEMIELNKKNKIILNAQAKQIERLGQENILIKNSVPQFKMNSSNSNMKYYHSHNNKSIYNAMSLGHKGFTSNIYCDSGFSGSTGYLTRPQTGLLLKSASVKMFK